MYVKSEKKILKEKMLFVFVALAIDRISADAFFPLLLFFFARFLSAYCDFFLVYRGYQETQFR